MSVRAGAAMHRFASWDSELCAGERLRLAGYRPAQAFVRGESVRKLKTESSKTQYAVLQQEQEHHMMRPLDRKIEFSDNLRGGAGLQSVKPLIAASCVRLRLPYISIGRFCIRSRLSFFLCQEKRSGLRHVSFLFRVVGIAICKFSCLLMVIGLRWFTSGLHVPLWRFRRGYEARGRGSTESAARLSTFCAITLALLSFLRGVRWG